MKSLKSIIFILLIASFGCTEKAKTPEEKTDLIKMENSQLTYVLPSPRFEGTISVEEALHNRRSHRSFLKDAISAEELSQVLWAAYGITKPLQGYPPEFDSSRVPDLLKPA